MILSYSIYVILIFFFNPGRSVSKCIINVTQPEEHLHVRFNQSVFIRCHVSMSCLKTTHDVLWYVFRTDSYNQLDIKDSPMKYRLQGTDLHINQLSDGDDGVYHCAALYKDSTNSGAQAIGTGTKLTVKDNHYSAGQVLLFTLVVLLSLYSLIILTFFICIKTGHVTLFKGRLKQSQDKSQGDSTKRVHFGAVVQELYSKRNLRRNKKNPSTEVSQENKVESSQSRREDIYQNLKRAR